MKRNLTTIFLVLALALSLVPAALATATERTTVEAVTLAALGVMEGDGAGELHLDKPVTRAEFAKMAVAASAAGASVTGESRISPYYDVPSSHWAAGYVAAARDLGLVKGYLDGLYHPNDTIRLEEGVTVLLRLLGYSDSSFMGGYPEAQLALYRSLDMDAEVTAVRGQTLTRRDCQQLFFNLLTAKSSVGQPYLTQLGYSLTPVGEINLAQLVNAAMEGPAVAHAAWQSQVPFALSNAVVYRDGKLAVQTQIVPGDVLYWAKSMRTVWAFSSRVTGTITAISPGVSAPTAVTVAGRSYTLGTVEAALSLSDLGTFGRGDTVTLLLGRDDTVAAVQKPGESGGVLYGVVSSVQTAAGVDGSGNSYQTKIATMLGTDGGSYTYPVGKNDFETGDLVQVTVSGGSTTVRRLSEKHLSGKVSADATAIGSHALAANVQILDVYEGAGSRVSASRLAGVRLSGEDVLFYATDAHGQIDRLLLDNVTGDIHQYGMLVEVIDLSFDMSINKTYSYLLNGQSMVLKSQGVSYPVTEKTAVQLRGGGLYALQQTKLVSVGNDGTATAADKSYLLADQMSYYEYRDGEYYLSSLDRIREGSFTLTGWYDDTAESGGRMRVIVAR